VSESILEGGCLCGAVRYRARGEASSPTLCHCATCRRASGAPVVAWISFPDSSFVFTRGKPVEFRSSDAVTRTFCGACGTALTYRNAKSIGEIDVTIASADDPGLYAPRDHIWTSQGIGWMQGDDGRPRYRESRERTLGAPIQMFGERVVGRAYTVRRAAYAVIVGDEGKIATVKTRRGHFLPGGGIERGESDESGLVREVREECAREVALARCIGEAVQWFRASRGFFEGHHVFFAGRFASEPRGRGEHELVWLEPARAGELLFHASHAWAIGLPRE